MKAGTQEWNREWNWEWNRNGMLINNTWATEVRRMEQSAEKDAIVDLTLDCEEKTTRKTCKRRLIV